MHLEEMHILLLLGGIFFVNLLDEIDLHCY